MIFLIVKINCPSLRLHIDRCGPRMSVLGYTLHRLGDNEAISFALQNA